MGKVKSFTHFVTTWSNLNYFRPPAEKFPDAVYITCLCVNLKQTDCVTLKINELYIALNQNCNLDISLVLASILCDVLAVIRENASILCDVRAV